MSWEIKNKKEIQNLKKELKKLDINTDLNSFSFELMFYSIDGLISKVKEFETLTYIWEKNIKPQKLLTLKSELRFLKKEIKKSEKALEEENAIMSKFDALDVLLKKEPENIIFYSNLKNWLSQSYKNIDKLRMRFRTLSDELITLENESPFFAFDIQGKIIDKRFNHSDYYEKIREEIIANIGINISREKLKKIILNNKEETEESEDF